MYKIDVKDSSFIIKALNGLIKVEDESSYKFNRIDNYSYELSQGGKNTRIYILNFDQDTKSMTIKLNGIKHKVSIKDKYDILLKKLGMENQLTSKLNELKAPMPGLIVEVNVSEGQEVDKGDKLLVLEAMKMENVIKSPGAGTVSKILVDKGDSVEKKQVLIEF